jgi:hypothetical protein
VSCSNEDLPNESACRSFRFDETTHRMNLVRFAIALPVCLLAVSAASQTNSAGAPEESAAQQKGIQAIELREQWRAKCIAGRRSICGKILRILPDGLLIESGYTNLLRSSLTKTWLVPGTVVASPVRNLVETKEPGAICVGTILLTDLPRGKPHPYDYVIICGYPTGETTCTTVGTIKKTVRRFSANLDEAVKANLAKATPPTQ